MPLCETCHSLNFEGDDGSLSFGTRLGEFKALLAKADNGCDACKFFCDVLQSSNKWCTRLDTLAERVVFLYNLRLDARKPTEVDLCSYGVDDLCLDQCVADDYDGPRDEDVDRVRSIPVDPRDERCFGQIRSWTSECAAHDTCSKPTSVILPEKIIKIPADPAIPPRLCSSDGRSGSYVTLSYCSEDVEFPVQSGSDDASSPTVLDVDSLPRTVVDAIDVARKLGYQYLWNRALCTTKETCGRDPSQMVAIYGQAALLLSATTGNDANSGLFHNRQVLYSPALGQNKDRYLRQRLLRWTSDIEESPLARGGWELVERMLAPRIVHFTERQLIWECASGFRFEASGIIDRQTGSGQIRQRYIKGAVQPYIDSFIQCHTKEGRKTGDEVEIRNQVARLEAWHRCVDAFSGGSVSVPSEKLLAMAPLASVFNDGTLGEYIAGSWSKQIAFGLAWSRPYFLLHPAPEYRAPSWSWASVDGAVSSVALAWPENLMQEHAASPDWYPTIYYSPTRPARTAPYERVRTL